MEREAIIRQLEAIAPPELAEEFDTGRIGLVIEGREEAGRICCALDASPRVVREGPGESVRVCSWSIIPPSGPR